MILGIVVNGMDSEEAGATTYQLAADVINEGHEVWVMSTGLRERHVWDDTRLKSFLMPFKSDKAINKWITLDVVLLRGNPSVQRAWAQSDGIHFGRLAMRQILFNVKPRACADYATPTPSGYR